MALKFLILFDFGLLRYKILKKVMKFIFLFYLKVFIPLLCSQANHKNWPAVVVKDVKNHIMNLRSIVYKVKGEINGQTLLPMPDGIERVFEVEHNLLARLVFVMFIIYMCT